MDDLTGLANDLLADYGIGAPQNADDDAAEGQRPSGPRLGRPLSQPPHHFAVTTSVATIPPAPIRMVTISVAISL